MSRGHRASPGEASCTYLPVQFPGDIGLVKERLAVHLSIPEQCPGDIGLVQERIAVQCTCKLSRGHRASQGEASCTSVPVQCPGDIGLVQERLAVHVYLYSFQGT